MLSQQDVILLWRVMSSAFGCPEKDDGGAGAATRDSAALQVALLSQRASRALPCSAARAALLGLCLRGSAAKHIPWQGVS